MPCCVIVLLLLALPRAALLVMWLFTPWVVTVFPNPLAPLLGLIFLPYTTLAYMAAMLNGGMSFFWMILVFLALLVDLGHYGGGVRARRRV